jgi:hypothetical protein
VQVKFQKKIIERICKVEKFHQTFWNIVWNWEISEKITFMLHKM